MTEKIKWRDINVTPSAKIPLNLIRGFSILHYYYFLGTRNGQFLSKTSYYVEYLWSSSEISISFEQVMWYWIMVQVMRISSKFNIRTCEQSLNLPLYQSSLTQPTTWRSNASPLLLSIQLSVGVWHLCFCLCLTCKLDWHMINAHAYLGMLSLVADI